MDYFVFWKFFSTFSGKKQHFLQNKEMHKNTKEAYTDGSKNMIRKVDFAAVFTDITKMELCLKKPLFT